MSFRQKINTRLQTLRHIPVKYYFVAGILSVMASYVVAFREQTVSYSYSGETCDSRLVFLPEVFSQPEGGDYEVVAKGGWNVFGVQITATSLCVSPIEAPDENSSKTVAYAPWGGWLARFTYNIEAGQHPTVDASVLDEPIPASRDLVLPLSEADATFSYQIESDEKTADCNASGSQLACDIPALDLKQGSKYELSLERYFNDEKIKEVTNANIETLSPLSVTKTSIKTEATVYDKPNSVAIDTDKSLEKAEFTVWRVDGDNDQELKAETTLEDKSVKVTFSDELPRQAEIELRASEFIATDGSTPLDPYVLKFKTSGGPKVAGVNVGSSGIAVGSQIIVTFDQELSSEQDLSSLISVSGGVSYQAIQGNQLTFSTSGASKCSSVAITLKPDIKSKHDISGQSAWQYSGRMSCYTVSTIGYSAQGRPINAYNFGSGGSSVVYTGAIHGNEFSTKYLMDRWIQELDANPSKIPAGKRIIVVPVINPDGLAAGTRSNSRNVDLNRNFNVSDWQKDVEYPGGAAWLGGGGKEPMSEPETKAIANFIASLRPELVISYHSVANYVVSNQRGQANARAQQYSSISGYRLVAGGEGTFGYQISGTADDYYAEKLGVASILIELGSSTYHEFERNQAAMWAMMR